jgi:hypothetical protein
VEEAAVEGLAAEVAEAAVPPILRHSILGTQLKEEQEKEQKALRASILSLGPWALILPALPFRWRDQVAGCLLEERSFRPAFSGLCDAIQKSCL